MNKELCIELNKKIGPLTFVQKQAGLVQTVEYQAEVPGENPGTTSGIKIERFPMSVDVDYDECTRTRQERELVPDGRLTGISYFEDQGINVLPKTRNGQEWESRLRFVCWMNRRRLTGNDYSHIITKTMGYVISQLTAAPFNSGPFTRCLVAVRSVPIANKQIFAAYTYDEAVTQYLMPPYEYFALDISVKFTVPYACLPDLNLTPSPC